MARVKLMAAMVIYLCAAAPADLEAADAEAAAVQDDLGVKMRVNLEQ